ncbi:HpcH/HpaI aldolase/citrate lyase family protein [Falsirhodobacter sp. 20TX0035]|uniref:HpcH/HpaI aldolase/citrate lyase family protein n=1 Tax=Falsirhodobacter sp. 20TX0035 TaxID=3022019 RepID=UPI00232EB617|nr:CoA ester lyase [Falsirhodobacter sp. 20TX0035]MDB6454931.1 CoA ester lyase [Falsirhodobacter sp. 20TX0035]
MRMLRRSSLTVPLSSEQFIAKAHLRGADTITLDLEDGVAPAAKPAARDALRDAVVSAGRGGAGVGVRINRPLRMAMADLEAAVIPGVAYISIAKAESADHVRLLSETILELEEERGLSPGGIGLTAAVESAAALQNAHAIAAADPRLFGIGLGAEDIAADCRMDPVADALVLPKQMIVFAARAAGIEPFGYVGTVADYTDLDGLREAVRRGRRMGFSGGSAIHPDQIPVLNEGFSPTPAEIDHARGIIAANDEAVAQGRGAFAYEGRMIDRPVLARALATLATADAIAAAHAREFTC